MMKYALLRPLTAALGAAGTAAILFSFFGGGEFLFAGMAFLIVLLGNILLSSLDEKKQFPVLAILFVILLAGMVLFRSALTQSAVSASIPLMQTLSEPYDVEMDIPKPAVPVSEIPAKLVLCLFISWFFLSASLSKAGTLPAGLISFFTLLLSFYYGLNPAPFGLVLSAAYIMTLPALLKSRGPGHPEIAAFGAALLLGLVFALAIPESRYRQPAIFAGLQEKIVEFVDPYNPVFHAGNAYTGMMKGSAGHQKLGTSNGIHYTGRIIADMEAPEMPYRLYLRSWVGGEYGNNQWKDLPADSYGSVKQLFEQNQGEWYDQSAWLMEVIQRNPALTQMLENYMDRQDSLQSRKKDFALDAMYEKTRFLLIPYDASFGGHFFTYDRSPVSPKAKAYSTYIWDLPSGALLSMMEQESISDGYYRVYAGAESRYRDWVYKHDLEIPDSVKESLSSFGNISTVKTLAEKRQRVEEIRAFLARNYTYSTAPGRVPAGKDFISYFLTENKKGYCTYFASAGVMLLRASGIPARYVTGMTAGTDEIKEAPALPDGLHTLSLNDRHAHAWAEVYVDGLGWRPVEFTPGYEGNENPFPIPADKQRNDKGAPDAPPDPKSPKMNPGSQKGQTPKNQPPGGADQPRQSPGNPPRLNPQQMRTPEKPLPKGLLLIPLVILALIGFLAYRLSAVSHMISKASESKESFNRLIDYMERLAAYKRIPAKGSYEKQMALFREDSRLSGLAEVTELLIKSKYSGAPLSKEEKRRAAALVKEARRNCIKDMDFMEMVKFRVLRKM
ncbi:transglutaminase domain-containing protein [uncultured Dialister sp.]|uniref:transglutaminase domain-containing protein n=1 Tax=uncultured Dialister sp. TaxID=278064 RepID=UPI0025E7A21E|nr:transglutaminase domain-containing protein [uncultured Dialister sp.]